MFERRYFVVAPSFHGATLLSKLLNDHPEVVSLGDTYPSNRFDQVCGCGEYVSVCGFWQRVAKGVRAERYRTHPHLLPDYPRILGGRLDRVLYNSLSPAMLRRILPKSVRDEFAQDFGAFATTVHEQQARRPAASVYVDGVKSISRVVALAASGVRVDGVIHLYRDPGDYVKSTMKQKGHSWQVFANRMLLWRLFHNRARRLEREAPYIALTYEGLTEQPDESLRLLFKFLGVRPLSLVDLAESEKDRPWHFMGNASLFKFDGTVRRSRHDLTARDRKMVRLMAGRYSGKSSQLAGRRS